jgi:hypothetical protein
MAFMGKASDQSYSEPEIVRRREEALHRMLRTPPKRHGEQKPNKPGVKAHKQRKIFPTDG